MHAVQTSNKHNTRKSRTHAHTHHCAAAALVRALLAVCTFASDPASPPCAIPWVYRVAARAQLLPSAALHAPRANLSKKSLYVAALRFLQELLHYLADNLGDVRDLLVGER